MKTLTLSHRLIVFLIRRQPPPMRKRLLEDVLRDLGLSRSQTRAATAGINMEQ